MGETTIFLIRHGRTRANEEERFSGRTGEPLLEKGRLQARKAGELLSRETISVVLSSPMVRSMDTGRIIANIVNAPLIVEHGIAEIRIPQWDGRLKADLLRDESSGYRLWKKDPASFSLPGAETLPQLQVRAVACLKSIASRYEGKKVVAVSHLAVMRCLVLYFSERDFSQYRNIHIDNARPLVFKGNSDHIQLTEYLYHS